MPIPLLIWYLIITICTGAVIAWRFIVFNHSLINFELVLLIGGFLYFGYMLIIQLAANGKGCNGCITADRTGFVQVHLAKYVFALSIGCLLLAYIINWLIGRNGESGFKYGGIYFLDFAYVYIVFPICCVVELFVTPRDRSPKLTADLISIIVFILIFTAIEMLLYWLWTSANLLDYFSAFWRAILFRVLFSVLGYFVYDFCLYKKNGESGGYTLFRS